MFARGRNTHFRPEPKLPEPGRDTFRHESQHPEQETRNMIGERRPSASLSPAPWREQLAWPARLGG